MSWEMRARTGLWEPRAVACPGLPQGQPPKVISVSMDCRNRASRLPFLARVQTGHQCSQKSGSNKPLLRSVSSIAIWSRQREVVSQSCWIVYRGQLVEATTLR